MSNQHDPLIPDEDLAEFVNRSSADRHTFWNIKRTIVVMTGVLVLNLVGLGINFKQNSEIRQNQISQERNSLINRVQSCKVQIALEVRLDTSCVTDDLLRLYDPEELIQEGNNFRSDLRTVLCYLSEKSGGNFPQVCGG